MARSRFCSDAEMIERGVVGGWGMGDAVARWSLSRSSGCFWRGGGGAVSRVVEGWRTGRLMTGFTNPRRCIRTRWLLFLRGDRGARVELALDASDAGWWTC